MKIENAGCGTGKKNFECANVVRAFIGETADEGDRIIELACNLDDMTPEELAFAMEELFSLGALDVYFTNIGMKKSRPGVKLTCMCREKQRERMLECIFKHTTTLGVREYACKRYELGRSEKRCGRRTEKFASKYRPATALCAKRQSMRISPPLRAKAAKPSRR